MRGSNLPGGAEFRLKQIHLYPIFSISKFMNWEEWAQTSGINAVKNHINGVNWPHLGLLKGRTKQVIGIVVKLH